MATKVIDTILPTTMIGSHDWGGTAVTAEVSRGIPGRLGEMYEIAPG